MTELHTRQMRPTDLPSVGALLDRALGSGFWSLDLDAPGSHLVAVRDDIVVGVVSASIVDGLAEEPSLRGPVGLVRLVAVDEGARGLGVATRLVAEAVEACRMRGVCEFAAFVWVHSPSGERPSAGLLERLGFERSRRLEGFYAAPGTLACPACGRVPCECAADLYALV